MDEPHGGRGLWRFGEGGMWMEFERETVVLPAYNVARMIFLFQIPWMLLTKVQANETTDWNEMKTLLIP